MHISRSKAILAGLGIFLVGFLAFFIGIKTNCKINVGQVSGTQTKTPQVSQEFQKEFANYNRPEESTYLTLPEWYIVYSTEEYASVLERERPSGFAYFAAVGQYWCTYNRVYEMTKGRYPFNLGNHVSLLVIGASFSAENILKGLYEHTLGRISEALTFGGRTEEDAYAARVAEEYGKFLYTVPWYEFPFGEKLGGLWRRTSLWGTHPLRKWERKLFLSVEYSIKSAYGWVIKKGTKAAYGDQDFEIMLLTGNIPNQVLEQEPRIRVNKQIDESTLLITIPRYKEFTEVISELSQNNIEFREIAGNHEILLTAIAPEEWNAMLKEGTLLFTMKVLTEPNKKRLAITAPVEALRGIVEDLKSQGIVLEHIYDF
jgi:hypothetical protein